MPRISVSVDEEIEEYVEQKSGEGTDYESRSAFVRECIRAKQREAELQTDLERVRREKRKILDQREEKRELQRYVEHDKDWHEADIITRIKWYLRGKD